MGSQRSSDLSLDEEREHFRRDTERQALYQLQRVRTKPVAFAVKTNCAFDGTVDDDSPVQVRVKLKNLMQGDTGVRRPRLINIWR